MRKLKTANHLWGNRLALGKMLDEDGYLFFRGLLDSEAITRLRLAYLDTLREIGVVDPLSVEPSWNGGSLDNFAERMKGLTAKEPWKVFRDAPPVAMCLDQLMGEDYIWLPSIAYRVTPPSPAGRSDVDPTSRFRRIHQDGYDNPGLVLTVCWVPLIDIDEELGGVAVAEGCHKSGYLHDTSAPTMFEVAKGLIPDDAWVWTNYKPGDLLVQHEATPHAGLSNQSTRFRLSMDFRLMRKSGGVVVTGRIVSIDGEHISIHTEEGRAVELSVDDNTYCPFRRGIALLNRGCIPRSELKNYLSAGTEVIVAVKNGAATLIRGFDIGVRV